MASANPTTVRARLGAALAMALVACSGSYFVAQPGDAGTQLVDAATVPSAVVPVNDAGVSPDAGAVDADAAPLSPCVGPSLFCDDFDDAAAPLPGRWVSGDTSAGLFDYDDSTFVSPKRTLRLQIPPAKGERSSSLRKDLEVPSGSFRASFALRVDLPDGGTIAEINPFVVRLSPTSAGVTGQHFSMAIYQSATQLEAYHGLSDGGNVWTTSRFVAPLGETFHMVVLTVRSSNGRATCTLDIDGKVVATEMLNAPTIQKISLEIGAPYVADIASQPVLRFDNLKIEAL